MVENQYLMFRLLQIFVSTGTKLISTHNCAQNTYAIIVNPLSRISHLSGSHVS